MKSLIFILALTHLSWLNGQKSNDKALIWRGFEHKWTYNHRVNRIGSFVCNSPDKYCVNYTSATGVGADSTFFTTHYSKVETSSAKFLAVERKVLLAGKEGKLATQTLEIAIPAPVGFERLDKYITLLNGFDIQALKRADKLQSLRIHVDDGEYIPELNEIHFKLHVSLVANCQSIECARFNHKSSYDISVHVLLVAGNDESFQSSSQLFSRDYPWGRREEVHPSPIKSWIRANFHDPYDYATIAMKTVYLTLNQEHWILEWKHFVNPLNYDTETGEMAFSLNLFFKEWAFAMKRFSAVPEQSRYSSRKAGWAAINANVILLQFKDARISHHKHEGALFWNGKNEIAKTEECQSVLKVDF